MFFHPEFSMHLFLTSNLHFHPTSLSGAMSANEMEINHIFPNLHVCYLILDCILPVVPAPVYAMRHRLVDSSHSLMSESLPDDSRYCNKRQHIVTLRHNPSS